MITVGVLGASGMIGVQLVNLLHNHPYVSKLIPFSRKDKGQTFSTLHPAFRHVKDLRFEQPKPEVLAKCDTVFMALPHGVAHEYVKILLDLNCKVIDLSSDFRIANALTYREAYGGDLPAIQFLTKFQRVVPEINGSICPHHTWFSVQGCTSTAAILATYPLICAGVIEEAYINVDAKVASSGAGNNTIGLAQLHFNRCNGVRPYKLGNEHRHCAEIKDFISQVTGQNIEFHLNVFSIDLVRGISCASYVKLKEGISNQDLRNIYKETYQHHPLVRIIKLNSGYERYPNPKWLCNTGLCDIGFEVDIALRRAVIISAIDNLFRGGASQAVQIFNLSYGFAVDSGIPTITYYP